MIEPETIEQIEKLTVGHYDQKAEAFWQSTKDHDVAQDYGACWAPFPAEKTLDSQGFGCGPGRDLIYFRATGRSEPRYGQNMQLQTSAGFWERAGFELMEHFYRSAGKPRHEQPWLAIVSRRK